MRRFSLVLLLLFLLLSACQSGRSALIKNIVGNWENSSGYTIEFRQDGRGTIPGVSDQIQETIFNYAVLDESHVALDLGDQNYTIEVKIDGDQLTWIDSLGEEIYTRVK